MRIALIQPNSPHLSIPTSFPSLGLLYISAYLKAHGYDPEYVDLTGLDERSFPILVTLTDNRYDVIAFSCQITQYQEVKLLKHWLSGLNPNALFVIGGPFPTHSPKVCEADGFAVIRGEGESPFMQVLEGDFQGKFVDPNFMPDWKSLDIKRYGYALEGKKCINIMTKRGNCPFHCGFCAKNEIVKKPLRFRTVESVLAEASYLKEQGCGAIAIYDDDVLISKERDHRIFRGLKKLGMPFRCMTRTSLATKEDLDLLKVMGCAEVAIGVETADDRIKKIVNKGTTIAQDTAFLQYCKKIGLRVKAYLMIGLPGETEQSVRKTLNWLNQNKPDNFDISIFTPYPGSPIYENKKDYPIDWNEEELQRIWFSGEAQYGSCAVWTPCLTSERIVELSKEFKRKEGGSTDYWKPL